MADVPLKTKVLQIVDYNGTVPPTEGTWEQGTVLKDSDGYLWECIVGGTPGTWKIINVPSGTIVAFEDNNPRPGWTYLGIESVIDGGQCVSLQPMLPANRAKPGVVGLNSKVYVIGGYDGSSVYANTLYIYDLATNSWTTGASLNTGRAYFPAVVAKDSSGNNMIYAIGGQTSSTTYTNTVEKYDPSSNTWSYVTNMPTARCFMGAAVVNNIVYVIGGYNGSYLTTNEAYNPVNDSWATKESLPVAKLTYSIVALDNKIYCPGGLIPNGDTARVDVYDTISNRWSRVADLPGTNRNSVTVVYNNRIYVLGGIWLFSIPDVNEYNPITNKWVPRNPLLYGTSNADGCLINGEVYLCGGYSTGTVNGSLRVFQKYILPKKFVYWFKKD